MDEAVAPPSGFPTSPTGPLFATDQVLRVLREVATQVHQSLDDLPATLQRVAEGVVRVSGFTVAAVNLLNAAGNYEVVAVVGNDDAERTLMGHQESRENIEKLLRLSQPWGRLSFLDYSLANEDLLEWIPVLPANDHPDAWHPEDGLYALLTTPDGERVGMLSVDIPVNGLRPNDDQREVLELFAEHAAMAISHARMFATLQSAQRQLEHQALHDPLTGLGNRTLLQQQATALAQAPRRWLGVIVADLDHFKLVNDAAGHDAGDQVLQVVAQRMTACLREGDVLARTGGDEFVIVVREADADAMRTVLERLAARLTRVLGMPVRGSTGVHRVGVSVGTAYAPTPVSLDELVRAADGEMYERKRHRRTHAR